MSSLLESLWKKVYIHSNKLMKVYNGENAELFQQILIFSFESIRMYLQLWEEDKEVL